MPEYILAYHDDASKMPKKPEDGAAQQAKFMAWMSELGDAVVNPGTPFGQAKMVSSDGISEVDNADRLSGFSTIRADSLDAAADIVKTCPYLVFGSIRVAEVMQMG